MSTGLVVGRVSIYLIRRRKKEDEAIEVANRVTFLEVLFSVSLLRWDNALAISCAVVILVLSLVFCCRPKTNKCLSLSALGTLNPTGSCSYRQL